MTQEEYRDMVQVWNDGVRYYKIHLELNVAGNLQGNRPHFNLREGTEAKKIRSTFQKYERKGENSQYAFMMTFLY